MRLRARTLSSVNLVCAVVLLMTRRRVVWICQAESVPMPSSGFGGDVERKPRSGSQKMAASKNIRPDVESCALGGFVMSSSGTASLDDGPLTLQFSPRKGDNVHVHGHPSEAEATRSLLQIDDEYCVRGAGSHRNIASSSTYRHYSHSDSDAAQTDAPVVEHSAVGCTPDRFLSEYPAKGSEREEGDDDEIGWRVDFDEEEARYRLEKAMRDQQRLRHEELYELQKVYTKALRKNFRSLRGMPEPSFDTPTALYEEELDALEERQHASSGAQLYHPDPPLAVADDSLGFRRLPGYCSQQDDHSSCEHATHHQHADCVDEASMVAKSSDVIANHALNAEGFDLGGGTHIHTTHGGGTSGDGGVLLGPSSFVSRLRRRTTNDTDCVGLGPFRAKGVEPTDWEIDE
jgi:hypothetical protein